MPRLGVQTSPSMRFQVGFKWMALTYSRCQINKPQPDQDECGVWGVENANANPISIVGSAHTTIDQGSQRSFSANNCCLFQ